MQLTDFKHSSISDKGMVATSQPLAVKAGVRMLEQGGNAVDAAIAAAVALTVVEPTSNGIGGDAFAIVFDGQSLQGFNASGRSPAALNPAVVRQAGFQSIPEEGWLSVTVPGAPSAWRDLHQRYGRLTLQQVFEPAINYAENGFEVSPVVATNWAKSVARFSPVDNPECESWMKTFTQNGEAPAAGERWVFKDHAKTLTTLVESGIDSFYNGDIAERIVDFAQATGGYLSLDDLSAHSNLWVDPVSTSYRGVDVYEIPPNGQGLAALIALAILDKQSVKGELLSPEILHHQIEAMKLGCVDAYRYVTDPRACQNLVALLLDPQYIEARANMIANKAAAPDYGTPPNAGTVYLATADESGMMVSYIQSNYEGFGSGIVIPDTGIAMQNRGAGFSMQADHPNLLAPDKRPFHTIIPGFLMKDGQALGPFGVMGGFMQPQGHVQVISAMIDFGLDPQSALDLSRWRVVEDRQIEIESSMSTQTVEELAGRGHEITVTDDVTGFERGQIILRQNNQYIAGSEPRADGMALGN